MKKRRYKKINDLIFYKFIKLISLKILKKNDTF